MPLKRPRSPSSAAVADGALAYVSPWVILAAWTVPTLLSTFETVMFGKIEGRPIEVWRAFLSEAPGWYTWALFTPSIATLAARVRLSRPLRARAAAAHVGFYLFVSLAASAAWAGAALVFRPGHGGFLALVRKWFVAGLPFTVVVYAAVVGISYSITARTRLRARERDAARLAQQLSEARLASLRMQLRPHFLFNSLNAIMALVRDGANTRAVGALALLSDMLRATLRDNPGNEVPLAEEVAFTRCYLEMEQLRFGERLRVTFDVPPELLDATVPLFVLQPFVENAIKHGILDRRRGGTIAIAAAAAGETLRLTVRDDGVGLAPGWDARTAGENAGVGITNARARLTHLYGDVATLRVGPGDRGAGVLVEVTLPRRHHRALDAAVASEPTYAER